MIMIIIWLLAIVCTFDSIFRVFRSNFNLGTFLMYCITAILWIYILFHRQIHTFCAAGFGYICKILFFTGCGLMAALMLFVAVSGYQNQPEKPADAIIVLGAGLRGHAVSGLLARRLDAAHAYYLNHPQTPIIVSGGQGPQEAIPESAAMKAYLIQKGVPEHFIWEESQSTSTEENFAFSKNVLYHIGLSEKDPIVYVTNAFHCYRAGKTAARIGYTDVSAIPASIGLSSILPCYMREALAVLYLWVFQS